MVSVYDWKSSSRCDFCFSGHRTIKDGPQLKRQDLSYNAAVCLFDSFFRQGGESVKKGVLIGKCNQTK